MSVRIIIMCCHTSNMSHCECVISRILITTFLLSLDKKKLFYINIRILNIFHAPTWVSCRSPWQPGRWLNLFRDETFALGLYKDPHGSMFIHRARCHSLFVPAVLRANNADKKGGRWPVRCVRFLTFRSLSARHRGKHSSGNEGSCVGSRCPVSHKKKTILE